MTSPNTTPRSLTWLITGCSSGFGLALTRTILASGRHTVIATSRDPSRTSDLVEEVTRSGGQWHKLDVTEAGASEALVSKLESEGTHIDVLVNNAGYNIFAPVETSTDDEIRGQMEAMFFGPLRLIRAVLPQMRRQKAGTIVNFSSGASLMGNESMGIYAGAKAGLDGECLVLFQPLKQVLIHLGLTRVLSKEVAPFNIRTLTVILGTFNTKFGGSESQSKTPLPEDYSDTTTAKIMHAIASGALKPNGDRNKAMQAVYEVVVGEGRGQGKEAEALLVLGNDMVPRVQVAKDHLQRGIDAFGDTVTSVKLDQ